MRSLLPALAALLTLFGPSSAEGCELDAPKNPSEARARVEWIHDAFLKEEDAMRLWYGGFAAAHTLGIGLSFARSYGPEGVSRRDREVAGVDAFSNALGLTSLLVQMPPLIFAARDIPRESEALLRAEARLEASSRSVRRSRSLVLHLLSAGYALASAAFIAFIIEDEEAAAIRLGASLLVGQARILLHPRGIDRAWTAYQAKFGRNCAAQAPPPKRWVMASSGSGLALSLRF